MNACFVNVWWIAALKTFLKVSVKKVKNLITNGPNKEMTRQILTLCLKHKYFLISNFYSGISIYPNTIQSWTMNVLRMVNMIHVKYDLPFHRLMYHSVLFSNLWMPFELFLWKRSIEFVSNFVIGLDTTLELNPQVLIKPVWYIHYNFTHSLRLTEVEGEIWTLLAIIIIVIIMMKIHL